MPPRKQAPPRKPGIRQRAQAAGRTARQGYRGAEWITAGRKPYSAKGMLTAELLAGVGIVAIRAVADYEPQADGTLKGKIGHPKGQYGPLPVLAGLLVTFFLLSFAAQAGGARAKIAVISGGLVVLVLGMKSLDEFDTAAATFSKFGKAATAGHWQTTGDQAGSPLTGGIPVTGTAPAGGTPPSGGPILVKPGKHRSCPPGYYYDAGLKQCVAEISGPPLT